MKGSIELESTPNKGSKATFIVPFKVSSWTKTPIRESFSTSPSLGFHSRVNTWTQPLAHRSINQDLLNQQISASVTTSFPSLSHPPSRNQSLDNTFNLQIGPLTPEQRSKIHVLVVEDKFVSSSLGMIVFILLTPIQSNQPNHRYKEYPQIRIPSHRCLERPRSAILPPQPITNPTSSSNNTDGCSNAGHGWLRSYKDTTN